MHSWGLSLPIWSLRAAIQVPPALSKNRRNPDPGHQGTLFTFLGKEASRTPAFTCQLCSYRNPTGTQQPSSQVSPWQPAPAKRCATPNGVRPRGSARTKVPGAQLSGPGPRRCHAWTAEASWLGFYLRRRSPSSQLKIYLCSSPSGASGPCNLWVSGKASRPGGEPFWCSWAPKTDSPISRLKG